MYKIKRSAELISKCPFDSLLSRIEASNWIKEVTREGHL